MNPSHRLPAKHKRLYTARWVHKISPSPNDVDGPFEIRDNAFDNMKTLAKALRDAKILATGESLWNYRAEGDKVVVFPRRSIWHAIVLEPYPMDETDQALYDEDTDKARQVLNDRLETRGVKRKLKVRGPRRRRQPPPK